MSSIPILFCKKFKAPYTTRTVRPNMSYSVRVKVYDYNSILVNKLELTKKYTKTKHFAILKLEGLNQYAYSDTFNTLYGRLTNKERSNLKISIRITCGNVVINIKLPNKEYGILDWGLFYPNNVITDE